MLLSDSQIDDFATYEDIYIDEVAAELRRWRNAVKHVISISHDIHISEITDVMIEEFLEELEGKQ